MAILRYVLGQCKCKGPCPHPIIPPLTCFRPYIQQFNIDTLFSKTDCPFRIPEPESLRPTPDLRNDRKRERQMHPFSLACFREHLRKIVRLRLVQGQRIEIA